MRTASKVFTIIGWITGAILAFSSISEFGALSILFFITWFVGIIVGIASMVSEEKKIGLGVALILFVNPLSGIFYLCWDGSY